MKAFALLVLLAFTPGASSAPRAADPPAAPAQVPPTAEIAPRYQDLRLPDSVQRPAPGTVVRVGTCDLPPWSIAPSRDDNAWRGIALQLIHEVGENLDLKLDVRSYERDALLDALEAGEVDIAATGIPITATNLARFSITPAFDESGLSIATHTQPPLTFIGTLRHVATHQVVLWGATLGLACVLFGFILWLVERRRNPPFEGGVVHGLIESSWWSVVTMFTVGYGDRVPVTRGGKLVAVVWMGLAFILVTVASGLVTSALTVQQLRPAVASARDLSTARVGCLKDSEGSIFCQQANIAFKEYETYEAAVAALSHGSLDAVVGSTVVLNYLISRTHEHNLIVLTQKIRSDYVGFGLRYGLSPELEKHIELEMLKVAQSDLFRNYRNALLGQTQQGQD